MCIANVLHVTLNNNEIISVSVDIRLEKWCQGSIVVDEGRVDLGFKCRYYGVHMIDNIKRRQGG